MLKNKEIHENSQNLEEDRASVRAISMSGRAGNRLERLLRCGVGNLSDGELLALILGTGGRESTGLLAERLLAASRGPAGLARIGLASLCRERGLGPARAARLIAALELGKRCRHRPGCTGVQVRGPADLDDLLEERIGGRRREHFLGLYLDSRHRIVAIETISIGSLNASLVHPREVFGPAVRIGVAAVIVAHNHPSGNTCPSRDDLELTRRLSECGRLLGIELLDHIVVGEGHQTSIRESGWPNSHDP